MFRSLTAFFVLLLCGLPSTAAEPAATVTVLYDNYTYDQACGSDWGFACVIKGLEKTILFDTGGKGDLLLSNFAKMKIPPGDVQLVVISHNHGDHTGGLLPFLQEDRQVSVFLPAQTPEQVVERVKKNSAEVTMVSQPTTICRGAVVFGPTGKSIIEQALVLETKKGLVMITGCSHPGIVDMARQAKEHFQKDIYMILGGTHLVQHSEQDVKKVIDTLKELGVQKLAPTHCTGDKAIAAFKEAFGDNFVKAGVGRVIELETD